MFYLKLVGNDINYINFHNVRLISGCIFVFESNVILYNILRDASCLVLKA